MKYLSLVVGILFLVSCDTEITVQDLNPSDSSTVTDGAMIATINGNSFTSNVASATITQSVAPDTQYTYRIIGTDTELNNIVIIFMSDVLGTGSYNLASNTTMSITYTSVSGSSVYAASDSNTSTNDSFTLEITSLDTANTTISGSFSATVVNEADDTDSIPITGSFQNITYQLQ